jgi:hypothetical protein
VKTYPNVATQLCGSLVWLTHHCSCDVCSHYWFFYLSERHAQCASRGRHSIGPRRGLWLWFDPTLLRHSFIHFTTFWGSGCLPPLIEFMLCNANVTGWVMPNLLFWVICCVSCVKESASRFDSSTREDATVRRGDLAFWPFEKGRTQNAASFDI